MACFLVHLNDAPVTVLDHECEFCHARETQPCYGPDGIPLGDHYHRPRVEDATAVALLTS